MMEYVYTLTKADIGKRGFTFSGRRQPGFSAPQYRIEWGDAIGPCQPCDVGKRVYRDPDDGVVQVENDAQRDARLRRPSTRDLCDPAYTPPRK